MIPEHYSRDIVKRCQSLLGNLAPKIKAGLPGDAQFGGTLQTTFLLAMATPMVALPVERIFKPSRRDTTGDDRELDDEVASRVAGIFRGEMAFGETPFAGTSHWSYVPNFPPFNIARRQGWPPELLERLASEEAAERARTAPASRVLINLRNALAHGGVTYLDKDGRNADGAAAMFAFTGARMEGNRIAGLDILRVHQDDFHLFLMAWAEWLDKSGIAEVLNQKSHLAA